MNRFNIDIDPIIQLWKPLSKCISFLEDLLVVKAANDRCVQALFKKSAGMLKLSWIQFY